MADQLRIFGDFLLVFFGFGLIIVVHELGHFVAARWAGVRVLAFAVGFGRAILTYRKGLGFRFGSSEAEAHRENLARRERAEASGRPSSVAFVSPTEYRLNVLPFGGYVKMLGQDDMDPTARSGEPDSYQNCATWKRMVIISAGVVMNIILAAVLFVIVFSTGLKTEAPVIGFVQPGSPAARATADNAAALGVGQPGLRPGDVVLSIDGERPESFNDLSAAVAMARAGEQLEFRVLRRIAAAADKAAPTPVELTFQVTPEENRATRLLAVGVGPASSLTIREGSSRAERESLRSAMDAVGLNQVQPEMTLSAVNGQPISDEWDPASPGVLPEHFGLAALDDAFARSSGEPVSLTFTGPGGAAEATIAPAAVLQQAIFRPTEDSAPTAIRHLLGLAAPICVSEIREGRAGSGLLRNDIIARLGELEYPTWITAEPIVKARTGKSIRIIVQRPIPDRPGAFEPVDLGEVPVAADGTIGFYRTDAAATATFVAAWPPQAEIDPEGKQLTITRPGAQLTGMTGSRILAVNDTPVSNFAQLRDALKQALSPAAQQTPSSVAVRLRVERPLPGAPTEEVEWNIDAAAALAGPGGSTAFADLGWENPVDPQLFEFSQVTLLASDPLDALSIGIRRTKQAMVSTYLTFARLFQGSVKVEHLKGPVGIAHAGTIIADRGFIWLLFFLGVISVNLAVVNFLPLPIVDGGNFLFLLYEQLTGRPVSNVVLNIATYAGLVLIAAVFLFVTYNDVHNLFR